MGGRGHSQGELQRPPRPYHVNCKYPRATDLDIPGPAQKEVLEGNSARIRFHVLLERVDEVQEGVLLVVSHLIMNGVGGGMTGEDRSCTRSAAVRCRLPLWFLIATGPPDMESPPVEEGKML